MHVGDSRRERIWYCNTYDTITRSGLGIQEKETGEGWRKVTFNKDMQMLQSKYIPVEKWLR